MTATPSPKGVEPEEPEPKLVIERDEDFSFVLEALDFLHASPSYTETMLAITGKQALEDIRGRLTTLTAERDEAQKRAEVAEAENKRMFAGMLAMMNTNQARAQSAAQSTAKIAQDLQNFLREHTSDVVKLEA